MKKYCFLDRDEDHYESDEEFDIAGEEYSNLLSCAMQYCTYFSLDYPDGMLPPVSLKPHIHIVKNIDDYKKSWEKCRACNWYDVRIFYRYNAETQQMLKEMSDSIFKFSYYFYGSPENPTFYREDYSIFFSSVTHEGDSFLFPKESEDVSVLLSNEHWREQDI